MDSHTLFFSTVLLSLFGYLFSYLNHKCCVRFDQIAAFLCSVDKKKNKFMLHFFSPYQKKDCVETLIIEKLRFCVARICYSLEQFLQNEARIMHYIGKLFQI